MNFFFVWLQISTLIRTDKHPKLYRERLSPAGSCFNLWSAGKPKTYIFVNFRVYYLSEEKIFFGGSLRFSSIGRPLLDQLIYGFAVFRSLSATNYSCFRLFLSTSFYPVSRDAFSLFWYFILLSNCYFFPKHPCFVFTKLCTKIYYKFDSQKHFSSSDFLAFSTFPWYLRQFIKFSQVSLLYCINFMPQCRAWNYVTVQINN